jgi:flagellar motor protein MotB
VTFDSGILFSTGNSTLTQTAQTSLAQFATTVLTPDMDLAIVGYTDNDPWRGYTAEQSVQKNLELSEQRAKSVSAYLAQAGANAAQLKYVLGKGEENPVASNATEAGKAENRRVEVYILPSKEMIESANAGTLK